MYNEVAIQHNAQVVRNYGPKTYRVYCDDNSVMLYGANNRRHLDMLLRIETNMDYIRPIKKIVEQRQCELPTFNRYNGTSRND